METKLVIRNKLNNKKKSNAWVTRKLQSNVGPQLTTPKECLKSSAGHFQEDNDFLQAGKSDRVSYNKAKKWSADSWGLYYELRTMKHWMVLDRKRS